MKINGGKMKLNLGCEDKILDGYVNVDIVDRVGNVTWDLNVIPYPFEDNSIDHILFSHTLPFLDNPIKVMQECHRICKNGAIINISVNHHSHFNNFTDLKQKVSFSYFTFGESWTNKELYPLFKVQKRFNFNRSNHKWMNFFMNPILNSIPVFYERFLCNIIPCSELIFELEVVK